MSVVIGTAGWSIASRDAAPFPAEGSALERYATRFGGVEINSSFYRPHRRSTWQRWAESVPASFRFSVKTPKSITHDRKLLDCADLLAAHIEEAGALGEKLAVHLVQLPPSLAFDEAAAERFFGLFRSVTDTHIVCEPRHASWFDPPADALLERNQIGRVAADPARVPSAALPGGWRGITYFRLHGSPVIYRSSYEDEALQAYAAAILGLPGEAWCIFDNTLGGATINALDLIRKLERGTAAGATG
jgi:uncharacterized protein YecE (DUF72 family)